MFIYIILSSSNKEGDKVISASNYLDWLIFSRFAINNTNHPKVISYINMQLVNLYFSLQKDIFNYKDIDICCFFFANSSSIFFMINVYSNEHQLALKYLKNTRANLYNILIIASDFNIRNRDWDLSYSFHSTHSNSLTNITDLFNLKLLYPI